MSSYRLIPRSMARYAVVMGMSLVVCTLSPKRRQLVENDPNLVSGLVEARRDQRIPGLLDLGKSWDALRTLLAADDPDGALDALLSASGGRGIGEALAFGKARVHEPAHVAALARRLAGLPADYVRARYPALRGKSVHGAYGDAESDEDDVKAEDERAGLQVQLDRLTALLAEASRQKHGLLAVMV